MLYLGAKKSLLSSGKTLAQQVAALFAGGEQGAWYEPSLTNGTLFQDSAGTTPVTAVGQPVGLMLDKSGRGNHATQPTTVNRPILQIDGNGRHFLAFNGTNSWMSTPAIDFTATDKATVVAGVRKLSDAAVGMAVELSVNAVSNNGSFAVLAPGGPGASSVGFYLRGDAATNVSAPLGFPAPFAYVQTALMNIAGATGALELVHRINGNVTGVGATAGAGNFGSYPLYIGARGGSALFANMNFYGLIVRGTLSSDPQIASAERFMNSKTGAW